MVFGRICGMVPVYVLGLGGPEALADNQVPILVALIGIIWGFFIHANLRWRFGPLEWLISTPAFHHWHHTLNGPINRNYSSTLPWLDWIFGTHYLPRDAWPEAYGIEAEMPESLVEQLAYPLFMQPSVSRQPAHGVLNPEIRSDASLGEDSVAPRRLPWSRRIAHSASCVRDRASTLRREAPRAPDIGPSAGVVMPGGGPGELLPAVQDFSRWARSSRASTSAQSDRQAVCSPARSLAKSAACACRPGRCLPKSQPITHSGHRAIAANEHRAGAANGRARWCRARPTPIMSRR